MLGGMGVLILLVVCANIANLVLVRGISRQGELAVRVALGASRGRLLRLLFVENMVMAVPGALAGVALGTVVCPWSSGAASSSAQRVYLDTSVDGYVLMFALMLSAPARSFLVSCRRCGRRASSIVTLMNDLSPRMARGDGYALCWWCRRSPSHWCCWSARDWSCAVTAAAQNADGGFDSAQRDVGRLRFAARRLRRARAGSCVTSPARRGRGRAGIRQRDAGEICADEPGRYRSRTVNIEGYCAASRRGHGLPLQRRRSPATSGHCAFRLSLAVSSRVATMPGRRRR